MASPTPADVRMWTERYGSPEAAADVAEELPAWKSSYVWDGGLDYWARVKVVLDDAESAENGDEAGGRGRGSNPIPKVPLDKAVKRLTINTRTSRNAIAAMEGLTPRKADWIVGWFARPDGLAWSERDGVRYPPGTRLTDDGTGVRLPPLPGARRAVRARPPAEHDEDDVIQIW